MLEYYDVTSSSASASDRLIDGSMSMSSEEEDGEVLIDSGATVTPVDDDLFTDGPFEVDDTDDDGKGGRRSNKVHRPRIDIVTKLLRIVETQSLQGANCQPGMGLNLGDRVVNRYAQERFQDAAVVAVNTANWLTR